MAAGSSEVSGLRESRNRVRGLRLRFAVRLRSADLLSRELAGWVGTAW
jgi:hypothetical protein